MIHLGEITPDTLPFSLNKQTYNKQHCETTHLKTKDGESVNYTNWNNYFAQTIRGGGVRNPILGKSWDSTAPLTASSE